MIDYDYGYEPCPSCMCRRRIAAAVLIGLLLGALGTWAIDTTAAGVRAACEMELPG